MSRNEVATRSAIPGSLWLAWIPCPAFAIFDGLSAIFGVGYDPVRDDQLPVANLPLFWCFHGFMLVIGCTVSVLVVHRCRSGSNLGSDALVEREVKVGWLAQFFVWLVFLAVNPFER